MKIINNLFYFFLINIFSVKQFEKINFTKSFFIKNLAKNELIKFFNLEKFSLKKINNKNFKKDKESYKNYIKFLSKTLKNILFKKFSFEKEKSLNFIKSKINLYKDLDKEEEFFIFNEITIFLENIKNSSFFSKTISIKKNINFEIKENFNLELLNFKNFSKLINKNIIRFFNYLDFYKSKNFFKNASEISFFENELNNIIKKNSNNFSEKFHTDLFNLYLLEIQNIFFIDFYYLFFKNYQNITDVIYCKFTAPKSLTQKSISFFENYDTDGDFFKNEPYENLIKNLIQYKISFFKNCLSFNEINKGIFFYFNNLNSIKSLLIESDGTQEELDLEKDLEKSKNLKLQILKDIESVDEFLFLSIFKKLTFFGFEKLENIFKENCDKETKKYLMSKMSEQINLYLNSYKSKFIKIENEEKEKKLILFPEGGLLKIFEEKSKNIKNFKDAERANLLINFLKNFHEVELIKLIDLYSKLNFLKLNDPKNIDEEFFEKLSIFLEKK